MHNESKLLIHKLKNFVQFYNKVSIPKYKNVPKNTKFKNFLENNVEEFTDWSTCNNRSIGALLVDSDKVEIDLNKCIRCLLCFSSNRTLSKLELPISRLIEEMFADEIIQKLQRREYFDGNLFTLPYFSNRKINSFEEFTSTNETTHISLWAVSVLNFLSSDPNSRIGKEIELLTPENRRDGRLDVCVINKNNILVCESKVDLDSLLADSRYKVQIPTYKNECEKFIKEFNDMHDKSTKLMIYLLIGGRESDLLPDTHPYCSSISGNKAERFYSDLIKHNIKFISANAIFTMMLYSLYNNKRLCWDKFLPQIFKEKVVGLLSAGMVINQGTSQYVQKIDSKVIDSSSIPLI